MDRKRYLKKGINTMTGVVPLLFLSPLVTNVGFKALQKGDIYFILVIGLVLCLITILLFFLGIRYFLKYLFD